MRPRRREICSLRVAGEPGDRAGRLRHGVTERTDQDELSVFEQIHDLAVRPGPQDRRSHDHQPRPAEVRQGIQPRQRLRATPDPREPDPVGAQARGHAQAHDVREGIAAGRAVPVRLLERRAEEPFPVPMVELPGRKTSQTSDLGRRKAPRNYIAEFHRCNSKNGSTDGHELPFGLPRNRAEYGERRKK